MPLPTNKSSFALTTEQQTALESEDSLLRGAQALEILNEAVKETGVVIPLNYVFKDYDRSVSLKAINAVFGLIGGVPAMAVWASTNPTEFYRHFAKQMPSETAITGGGNISVTTNLPSSQLDKKTMDAQGFVTATVRTAVEDDDGDDE